MQQNRFEALDGWRAISILCVLACHLLPIGPKSWHLNFAFGAMGMSLFFTLSGFLVTHMLLENQNIKRFLTRRLFRILPLAWAYLLIAFICYPISIEGIVAHFLFYANYPPKPLIYHVTDHFWSLCVEVQFYIGIALIVSLFKKRGLLLLPVLCISVTLMRVQAGEYASVITQYRIDEILVGGVLALIYHGELGKNLSAFISKISPIYLIPLLFLSSHSDGLALNYLRPYIAAVVVGATLYQPDTKFYRFLCNKYFSYIATISYALYVVHPILASSTWLGSGDSKFIVYLKRPLLFVGVFLVAHISTFYFERHTTEFGKKLSKNFN